MGLEPWFARVADAQRAIADASLDDVLRLACVHVRDLLDADTVVVATPDDDRMVVRAVEGSDIIQAGESIPVASTLMGRAVVTRESQLCHDGHTDPRTEAELNTRANIRSSVVAPLLHEGRAIGSILAGASTARGFDDTDLALLDLLATAAAGRLALTLRVSEQEDMRGALMAQSRLLQTVFDGVDIGLVVHDAATQRMLLSNEGAFTLLGLTEDEVHGRIALDPRWRCRREDGTPVSKDELLSVLAATSGAAVENEVFAVQSSTGETRWISVTTLLVHDLRNGAVTSVVGTVTDVTATRDAAAGQRDSERRLASAQSLAGLGWYDYDAVSDTAHWSEHMWEMFGLEPRPIGLPMLEFLSYIHPEDRADLRDRFGRIHPDSSSESRTYRIVRPDGSIRTLRNRVEPKLDADGTAVGIFGTALDITETESTLRDVFDREERFRVSFDAAPIGMSLLDMRPGEEGRMVRINPAFREMLGYDDAADLEHAVWTHPDDLAPDWTRFGRLLAGEVSALSYSKRYVRADGSVVHALVWSSVVADAGGHPAYLISHILDITEREAAHLALQESERRLADAQHLVGLAWWDWDVRSGAVRWSDQLYRLAGKTPGEPVTACDLQCYFDGRDPVDLLATVEEQLARTGTDNYSTIITLTARDGGRRFMQCWVKAERDDKGTLATLRGAVLDVTEREQAQQALKLEEERFRVAFAGAPIGMTLLSLRGDDAGRTLQANAAHCAMLGYTEAELIADGEQPIHPDELERHAQYLQRFVAGELGDLAFETRYLHRSGRVLHAWVHCSVSRDAEGRPAYLITHCLDISERLEQQEALKHLALTDTLTGLANRTLLEDRLTHALDGIARGKRGIALLLLDLDRFKLVNDTLGHQVGDALLVEVADRLTAVSRPSTTIARLGGDEFVVLVEDVPDDAEVTAVAARIVEALRAPFALPTGDTVTVTASVGIATSTCAGRTGDELMREADLALYRAKDAGRDRFDVYDAALRARAVTRLDIEFRLRRALAEDGLRFVVQPVVALDGSTETQAEALVRLHDPEIGLVPPLDFIEVAEDSGLIADVDTWVMEHAVALLADERCPFDRIAVNVSARTLERPDHVDRVRTTLDRYAVPGHRLVVELTESSLLDGSRSVIDTIRDMRSLGIEVGIDDFGTGYSALAYLNRFRLDFLKIDRSFIAKLEDGDQPVAVVKAIIDLAHAHELTVTAEGIETEGQAERLRRMGCDHGQGWLFGRPESPSF